MDGVAELKTEKTLTGVDDAQLLNYLHGTGKKVGYLFNFGQVGKAAVEKNGPKRIVQRSWGSYPRGSSPSADHFARDLRCIHLRFRRHRVLNLTALR